MDLKIYTKDGEWHNQRRLKINKRWGEMQINEIEIYLLLY